MILRSSLKVVPEEKYVKVRYTYDYLNIVVNCMKVVKCITYSA